MDETTNSIVFEKPSTLLVVREVVRSTSKEIAHFIRDKPTVILSVFIIGIWAGAFSVAAMFFITRYAYEKLARFHRPPVSSPRPARQKSN